MPSLTNLSVSSSAFSVTSGITQENEAERALADTLQAAHEQYLAFPGQSSVENLKTSLNAVINKLEKDQATAMRLAKEANDRLSQERTDDYSNSGITGFVGGLTARFKAFIGSDNAASVEHYNQLAAKYSTQLEELSQLRDALQQPVAETVGPVEITEQATNRRRLLQTANFVFPTTISSSFCYPTGACDLSALSNGLTGFALQGETTGDNSGLSVSTAGDINGDGLSDVVVGAPYPLSGRGKTYVVFGSENETTWGSGVLNLNNVTDGQQGFALRGENSNDYSGVSVSSAGDINGDGLSDLIISASAAGAFTGETYVVFGSRNTTAWGNGTLYLSNLRDGQHGFVLLGEAVGDNSGRFSMTTTGDINGDGLSDIIIASRNATPPGKTSAGKSYVIFGSRNSSAWGSGVLNLPPLMDGQRGFVLQGEAAGDNSGTAICLADINGDGLSDLIVGAYRASPITGLYAGKIYVIFGSRNSSTWGTGILDLGNLTDGQRGFALLGETANDNTGCSVSAADINGDGLSDLIIGALTTSTYTGKTYVIFGSRNNSVWGTGTLSLSNFRDGQRGFVLQGETPGDTSGVSVGTLGDINGDGTSELIIGAYTATPPGKISAGKSYIVFGSKNNNAWGSGTLSLSNFKDGQRGFVLQGEGAYDSSGISVNAAGDIKGDGSSNIIVGAYNATFSGKVGAGKSYVVFGASPIHFTANYLSIGIGETTRLTPTLLAITTTRPDININTSRVTFQNVTNGYFTASYAPTTTLTTCYMQNITDGFIRFVHTGNTFPPQYRVVIDLPPLGLASSVYSDAQVNFLGYRPNLIIGPLYIDQNATVLPIQTSTLNGNDQDNTANELFFIISNLTHGQFNIYDSTGALITPNVTTFSLQTILDRHLGFVHDGSAFAPSYQVALRDTQSTTDSEEAIIIFNSPPALSIRPPVTLDEGQATILRPQDIEATDAQTPKESVIIQTNVTAGYVSYTNNPSVAVTEFPQLLLTIGSVQFVHNVSNMVPTLTLRAFDGSLYSAWQTAPIYFNRKPLLEGHIDPQTVTENENFYFTLPPGLFRDPDANDTLTYLAQLKGLDATTDRAPLPPEIRFSPPGQFSGNLPTVSSYNIEIEARDPRGLTNSTSFILSSQASADTGINYQLLQYALSTIGSVILTIMAYSWFRRRTAMHRRGFSFSNTLRKVLNLEYYDFMRFEGEVYRSKIEKFLERLETQHGDFYKKLTEEEKHSFAVCLAQVLINHGLVSPSNCGWGCFDIICCIAVGWPSQLDLKKLEQDDLAIAKEAVDTWNEYNGYKLLEMGTSNKKNAIYIEMDTENNTIHYVVNDFAKRGDEKGDITAQQLGLTALPKTFAELEKRYSQAIIKIASENGHTKSGKGVKKWPYDSPTCWKKFKVFVGCEKSHTATFFTPPPERRNSGGVELTTLEKREGSLDESTPKSKKPPTFAERLHFLEEFAVATAAQVGKIAHETKVELGEDVPLLLEATQ